MGDGYGECWGVDWLKIMDVAFDFCVFVMESDMDFLCCVM